MTDDEPRNLFKSHRGREEGAATAAGGVGGGGETYRMKRSGAGLFGTVGSGAICVRVRGRVNPYPHLNPNPNSTLTLTLTLTITCLSVADPPPRLPACPPTRTGGGARLRVSEPTAEFCKI